MLQTFRQALTLLDRREKRRVHLLLMLSGAAAIVQTVAILSIMPFIVLLANPEMLESNRFLSRLYHSLPVDSYSEFLAVFGVFGILVLTIGNLFLALEHWISNRFLCFLGHRLEKLVLRRMLDQPYEYFLRHNTARLSDVVLTQVERMVDGVIGRFIGVFGSFTLSVFVVLLLLVVSLRTTLVTLTGLVALYLSVYLLLKHRIARHGAEITRLSGDIFTIVREMLDGIKEIKTRRVEEFFASRFERPSLRMSSLAIRFGVLSFLPNFILETVVFAALVAVALYFILATQDAGVSLSYIALYGISIYRLIPSMKGVFEGIADMQHNADSVRIVLEHATPRAPPPASRPLARPVREIRLGDVSYRFEGTGEAQLVNVSVAIPAGSSLCLFGPSGAGKSTLLNILAGLLQPQRGALFCDDTRVSRETIGAWRRMVGYCPQDIFLFDDTIASNVAFGTAENGIDSVRISAVAEIALLDQFVNDDLERGFDTVIGQDGKTLSGGQRQRVGIARALYHDPDVIILDESVTGLDDVNKLAILDRLFALAGKTLVFSSHDPAVAGRCDMVAVLDRGRLVAHGRYEDLVNTSQRFSQILAEIDR